jgi:hypothetical protein
MVIDLETFTVPYASAVGSLMSAQVRAYPDVVHVSGMFWQKSSPDIDHWNEVKDVLQFCKVVANTRSWSFNCGKSSKKQFWYH